MEQAKEDQVLLTIPQASRRLGIGRTTAYHLITSGELEAVHIGRSVRVPAAALDDFVARARAAGAVNPHAGQD